MSGICREHAFKKQKACQTCGNCPFCPPLKCRDSRHRKLYNNIVGRKLRKRKGGAVLEAARPSRRSGRRRSSSSVGEYLEQYENMLSIAIADDGSGGVSGAMNNDPTAPIPALTQASTEHIGDVSATTACVKKPRFIVKPETLRKSLKMQQRCTEQLDRVFRRAGQDAVKEEAKLLCPADPALLIGMCAPRNEVKERDLVEKCAKVAMQTDGMTSEMCLSLLASVSASASDLEKTLLRAGTLSPAARPERARIGCKRFKSLQLKGKCIEQGDATVLRRYYKAKRVYLDKNVVRRTLEWLHATLQLRPGKLRSFRVGKVLVANMPILYLNDTMEYCYANYQKHFQSKNERLGQNIFYKLLSRLTDKDKAQAGLSYFYTDFIETAQNAEKMLQRAAEIAEHSLQARFKTRFENVKTELKEVIKFIKYEYASHLQEDSDIAAHCMHHALGASCSQAHTKSCEQCDRITSFYLKLEHAFDDIPEMSPELESCQRACPLITEEFDRFQAHILRTKWQQSACEKIIEQAIQSKDTAVIILDHKQKVLARRLKESQMQYYAKKGMSLLGAMVILGADREQKAVAEEEADAAEEEADAAANTDTTVPDEQPPQSPKLLQGKQVQQKRRVQKHHFIDMILSNTSDQKANVTCACIEALLSEIGLKFPQIERVYFQSDNAGPFSATMLAPFCYLLNKQQNGLPKVLGWTYTEAQSGKSMLDGHFSYVNIWIDAWVMKGDGSNVIFDPWTLFEALSHDGPSSIKRAS